MSRLTSIEQEKELISFVEKAALCFLKSDKFSTYTESGNILPGDLMAVRWGLGNDCIMVFRISDDFEPRVYQQVIKTSKETD